MAVHTTHCIACIVEHIAAQFQRLYPRIVSESRNSIRLGRTLPDGTGSHKSTKAVPKMAKNLHFDF